MTATRFTPAVSVNDVLRESPAAAGILNRLGIDTCCGGSLSLADAAAAAGLPLADLLAAIAHPTGAA